MARYLFFGALFGFVLSRVDATDYDAIAGMFLLSDLHLFGVIGVAIATAGLGLFALRRLGARSVDGSPLALEKKPRNAGNLWGGLIFGAGGALTGTCPGTALAQLGEGKLVALFTLVGLLLGTALYRRYGGQVMDALSRGPLYAART